MVKESANKRLGKILVKPRPGCPNCKGVIMEYGYSQKAINDSILARVRIQEQNSDIWVCPKCGIQYEKVE